MTGYTSPTQSGLTVLPAPVTFLPYSLPASSTTQLAWPVDNFPGNQNVVALLASVTPLGSGCTVQMPSALNTSTGEKALFYNPGSFSFVLADSTGATIVSINPGTAWFVALTGNTTSAGTWLTFQFGAGTSAVNAAALAGPGIGASGAVLQQIMVVNAFSTNYTATGSDRDNLLNWVGGAGTLTLPTAGSVGNNFYIQVRDSGSGSLSIAAQGPDQINGAASITLNVNDSCFVVSDGVNWWTIGLGSIQTNIFNFTQLSLAGQSGTVALTAAQQNKVAYRFIGALAGATNIQVPATIQQYWVDNETTGGFALGIGTAAQITGATQFIITNTQRFILYCDGTNVLNAVSVSTGLSNPVTIVQGGTGATTAPNALTNLGGTSVGTAVFTAANAAAALSAIGAISASDTWAIATGLS